MKLLIQRHIITKNNVKYIIFVVLTTTQKFSLYENELDLIESASNLLLLLYERESIPTNLNIK